MAHSMKKEDYSEQIKIPSDFFAKALKEYQNWRFAWIRETIQNSADAGATQIDFQIESINEEQIKLSVTDNGCGMDITTLRRGFLTLGGSIKDTVANEQAIGGYGYAKHIILFAHQQYQIHSRDCLVSGAGSQYAIEPADDYFHGTHISVILNQDSPVAGFTRNCRRLVKVYQTIIKITLNGEELQSQQDNYDYQVETKLGLLQFSEEDESDVTLWIRMRGLPMFNYYLYSSGQRGLSGTLDLKGEPTELLTANRDGLNFKSSGELNNLLHELINQRQQFKQRNQLNLVFNASSSSLAKTTQLDEQESVDKEAVNTSVFQEMFSEQEQALQYRVMQALEQMQKLQLITTYPDNFHLHIADIQLRREQTQKQQITLSQIKYTLNLHRSRKLAWCWLYAVQWSLETDYLKSRLMIKYDEKTDRYTSLCFSGSGKTIDAGFVFDADVEGLNIRNDQEIKILLNPLYFQSGWLMGDLLDVAIHECAHCVESGHGELFIQAEGQIRKDLRRMINERQVLQEAKEALKVALEEAE